MKLADFIPVTGAQLHGPDVTIQAIATDTRSLKTGDLFVALKGENFDGHNFIGQAKEAGAIAVVVDHLIDDCSLSQLIVGDTTLALGHISILYRQSFTGPLVAITGSCGKTSVKGFLKSIFELQGSVVATAGNLNNHIGVPLTLNRLSAEDNYAVIEMGASGIGEIQYLAQLAKPTVAVVNNIRPAHVLGFGGIDAIAIEKGTIYSALGEDGTAVINFDDAYCAEFSDKTKHLRQIGFTRKPQEKPLKIPFVTAKNIVRSADGSFSFDLVFESENQPVHLNVLGEHFIDNAMAAAACALAAGLNLDQIARGLEAYVGEQGRMQPVPKLWPKQLAALINDAYNANPASVRAAVDYLSQQTTGPTVLVFGDMGELGPGEKMEHTAIGLYAAEQGIDVFISTGPLSALAAEAFSMRSSGKTFAFDSVSDAELEFSFWLSEPCTMLLKGSRSSGVDRLIQMFNKNNKRLSPC